MEVTQGPYLLETSPEKRNLFLSIKRAIITGRENLLVAIQTKSPLK
jgi:hypothetical protein